MTDVLVKFEREGLEGLVAVGTYLSDAAGRMGIELTTEVNGVELPVELPVTILSGAELLSVETTAEIEFFKNKKRKQNERLASQTKAEKEGEITIMTTENKKEKTKEASEEEDFTKEFTDMPLEKKIAQLVRFEAIALGETLTFVANSPYLVFDKIMDVMAEFGLKKETDEKEAARPKEHVDTAKKVKKPTAKKTSAKKPAAESGSTP